MKNFLANCATARLISAAILLVGCGSKHEARSPQDVAAIENAGRVEAASDSERAILKSLDELPSDVARTVGGETVKAEEPYSAASGEQCRYVSWSKQRRLACRESAGWYFVPDVFGTAGST